MEIVGLLLGFFGIAVSIYFGIRSKKVENAFSRYVTIDDEIRQLEQKTTDYEAKIRELENQKTEVYRHFYTPKSKAFVPGDRVKLLKTPKNRGWISANSVIGMTGIIVDYGPGTYEYLVYWSEADYKGEPMDEYENRWQAYLVNKDQIERIS